MEAGFKIESFACFVSETSRNIYGKEQRLPKGLQELLVSWWGCTQHIPQLLASAWAEPEFQRAPRVPRAASSWSSSFSVWELHAWGGNKKHSQVFHSDGLSSILTPKAVWTKTGLLPGEHLEGLEMESTSSTWTWGATKAAFLKTQKHIPHRWVNCDRNRGVHGKVTEANSPGFIFKSSTWTVNILMLVCPYVIWDHDWVRGDFPATVSEMFKMEPAAIHHIDHSCNTCYGSISPGIV